MSRRRQSWRPYVSPFEPMALAMRPTEQTVARTARLTVLPLRQRESFWRLLADRLAAQITELGRLLWMVLLLAAVLTLLWQGMAFLAGCR